MRIKSFPANKHLFLSRSLSRQYWTNEKQASKTVRHLWHKRLNASHWRRREQASTHWDVNNLTLQLTEFTFCKFCINNVLLRWLWIKPRMSVKGLKKTSSCSSVAGLSTHKMRAIKCANSMLERRRNSLSTYRHSLHRNNLLWIQYVQRLLKCNFLCCL